MRTGYRRWAFLMGLAFLSSACAVTPEQFQGLQQDVRALRGDLNTLAKQWVVSEERLQQIDAILKGTAPGGAPTPDLVARFEELVAETRMIQGRLEEDSHRLSELSRHLDEVEVKVRRLMASEPGVRPGAPPLVRPPGPAGTMPEVPTPVEPTRPGVPPPSTPVPGQPLPPAPTTEAPVSPQPPTGAPPSPPVIQPLPSPEEVYKTALSDYTKGSYDLAISGFKTYLTFFPKTVLEDKAQYWLAETYYSKGEYLEAIRQYDILIAKYSDSEKLPGAYYKKALAYREIGENLNALATLKELKRRFPKAREARLAEDEIKNLEGDVKRQRQ